MEFLVFILVIGIMGTLGILLNHFLRRYGPIVLFMPSINLLVLISISLYFAFTVDDLGQLAYIIFLLVLVPVTLAVGMDAILQLRKLKK